MASSSVSAGSQCSSSPQDIQDAQSVLREEVLDSTEALQGKIRAAVQVLGGLQAGQRVRAGPCWAAASHLPRTASARHP
jgi:hypothetical protein